MPDTMIDEGWPDPRTMVERVAHALCSRSGINPDQKYRSDWSQGHEPFDVHWRSFQPEARCAIETMREPSEAMKAAGNAANYDCSEGVSLAHLGVDLGIVWQAMIDAALAEGQ